ncbi:hypothetical protein VTL71DRAFT_3754 [Oculimacula yallundae]|uniref:Aminoglycoside phosphotransferase domain-containing protein n=1 Tax=Oculimacula yallundae TaxID=86028 RepID=A0ABR4C4J5_9HELO
MSVTTAPPVLRKAMEDGSEAEISEEELYEYRRYRWLSDEPEKLAVRYRRFNLDALLDVAVKTVAGGARSCTKVLKCVEGQFNKAFLMTMDNGAEILAKIPNPNVGSAFYTTASEVATRNFVREFLNFPVPRIHTYSLDPLNPVGVEYIIEEKAGGKPLGNLWRHWPRESQQDLVTELVDLEAKLASVSFQSHGCIYYKDDLKTKGVRAQSLEATYSSIGNFSKELDPSRMAKFVLGPLNQAVLWQGERATMDLERGPWQNPVDYMLALATNEIQWTKTYAAAQMNYCRPVDTPELPEEYISLLERYLILIPHLAPIFPEELHSKTLCLRDLHLDNIFVDPDTKKITHIIDWQATSVSETFFQYRVPAMLPPSSGYKSIPESMSEGSRGRSYSGEGDDILRRYQDLTRIKNPLRWAAISHPHKSILQPVSQVSGAWSRNDVFSLRHALITIAAHWQDIYPNSTACPISFTDQELWLHNEEMELLEELGTVLHLLQDQNLIAVGGRVLRDDYERAAAVNTRVKEMFVDIGEDEQHKALYEKIWPY